MDTDTILNVGAYCEGLLSDPTFQSLSAYFEQVAVEELLASKPHETKLRESIFARVSAHRDFLSMLGDFVKQKHEAEKPPADQTEVLDDPSVHEIYKGIID